jgi:hypothetical protein
MQIIKINEISASQVGKKNRNRLVWAAIARVIFIFLKNLAAASRYADDDKTQAKRSCHMNVFYNICVCALYLTLSDMISSPPPPQSNLNCVEKKRWKMGIRRVMTKHIKYRNGITTTVTSSFYLIL